MNSRNEPKRIAAYLIESLKIYTNNGYLALGKKSELNYLVNTRVYTISGLIPRLQFLYSMSE